MLEEHANEFDSIIERRNREQVDGGRVENEETIPLIPNIKADQRRTVVHLEVWKQDPPNDGFRGTAPTSTDYASIAKLYGNGVYEFRAVTQDGKVLRRQQAVKITYTPTTDTTKAEPMAAAGAAPDMALLRWQAEQHAADSRRIEDFGRMSVESTRDMARSQLESQSRLHEAQIMRDREYHAASMQQQQQFFQQMMMQVQTFHNQSIERSSQQNQLVISVIQQSHERISRATDPTALLSVFQQGMMLSQGMAADDEPEPEEPWVKAIESGAGIVKDFVELSKTGPRVVAAQAPTVAATQSAPKTTAPTNGATHQKTRRESPFSRSEIALMIRAKRIMQQKGLDFEGTVNNALRYIVHGAPSESEPQPIDDAGDDTSADSEPAETADVEDV